MIDKITIYKTLCFSNTYINSDIPKTFLFADINIIHQKISLFLKFNVQVATKVIKTYVTSNNNPESNTSSFCNVVK